LCRSLHRIDEMKRNLSIRRDSTTMHEEESKNTTGIADNDVSEKPSSTSVGTNHNNSVNHRRTSSTVENYRMWISFFAGVGSSAAASVFCAPLDLVRTRLQVLGEITTVPGTGASSTTSTSLIKSFQDILRVDGVRGCFRGLGATLFTVPTFWGMYFSLYETAKRELHVVYVPDDEGGMLIPTPPEVHIVSAIFAGAIADFVCNPLFVVRTRMQTEALHYFERPLEERKPHGILSTVKGLYREGGQSIFIFWRGLSASLLGLSHVAIQFPVYERLKIEARRYNTEGKESPIDFLLASALSKMTATTLTYPHEVLRSRMMDHREGANHSKSGLVSTFRRVVQHEGYGALYTGLKVTLIRVIPNACITFMSYEMIMRYVT